MNQRSAYKRPISPPLCAATLCTREATFHVFGCHGTHFGDYCDYHADERIETLDAYEKATVSLGDK